MTIADEIARIKTNISNAYTSCQNKGATLPETQNSANLATTIDSISGGSSPTLVTKEITENGTYSASDDNADGYSSVTVNVAGGGSGDFIGIPREVSPSGVYQVPSSDFAFTLPDSATDLGIQALYYAFYNCTNLKNVDLSSLTNVSGGQALYYAFYNCTGLTNVDFSNLKQIGSDTTNSTNSGHFSNCFNGATKITNLSFPSLEKIYCTAYSSGSGGTFYNNNRIQKMYFPKLNTITYSPACTQTSYQKACDYIFANCTSLTEIHFGAENKSAIQATTGYSTLWGRGAGKATVYFDL